MAPVLAGRRRAVEAIDQFTRAVRLKLDYATAQRPLEFAGGASPK